MVRMKGLGSVEVVTEYVLVGDYRDKTSLIPVRDFDALACKRVDASPGTRHA